MSDAWEEIQAIKSKRNSLRERLEKRKKERQDILGNSLSPVTSVPTQPKNEVSQNIQDIDKAVPSPTSTKNDSGNI